MSRSTSSLSVKSGLQRSIWPASVHFTSVMSLCGDPQSQWKGDLMGASWLSTRICSKSIKLWNNTTGQRLVFYWLQLHLHMVEFFALNSWVGWNLIHGAVYFPHDNRIHVYYIRAECTSSLFFWKLQVYKKEEEKDRTDVCFLLTE